MSAGMWYRWKRACQRRHGSPLSHVPVLMPSGRAAGPVRREVRAAGASAVLSERTVGACTASGRQHSTMTGVFALALALMTPNHSYNGCLIGSHPLHHLVSDSATPHDASDPLPQPVWGHRSTGRLMHSDNCMEAKAGGGGMHQKGRDPRGGPRSDWTGGWRRLSKRFGAVTVGYKCQHLASGRQWPV